MTNGECPTWFVFGWLEKHPTHDASAPETSTRNLSTAVCVGGCVEIDTGETQGDNARIKPRSDWTIYNERGEPVELKRKRKPIRVGTLLVTNHGGLRIVLGESFAPGEYDLFTLERKS